jgi:hypothetical protein
MGRLRQEISEGGTERNKLVADRRWRDKSTANQEQARIVGMWRDKGQGMSMGDMMQSREATLTKL